MATSCHFCGEPITRHENWTTIMDWGAASRTYHDDCWELDIDEHRERGERLPEDQPSGDPAQDRRALN